MSNLDGEFYAAEVSGNVPEIDLHGDTVDVALSDLDTFLHSAFMSGDEIVKVIHGRGTGALHKAIRDSLKHNKIVKEFRNSTDPSQIGGVTLVALQKGQK